MEFIELVVEFADTEGTGYSEDMINDLLRNGDIDEDSLIETDTVYFNKEHIMYFYPYKKNIVVKLIDGTQYNARITKEEFLAKVNGKIYSNSR